MCKKHNDIFILKKKTLISYLANNQKADAWGKEAKEAFEIFLFHQM